MTASTSDKKLRKAAILIASLDTAAADRLLDQMGPQQAAKVRDAIMELDDFSPAEQAAVIAEFMRQSPASTTAPKPFADDAGVELEQSLTKKFESPPTYRPGHGDTEFVDPAFSADQPIRVAAPEKPFRALDDAPAEKLARHLQREHPQLIAVVLANLPPERAADILSFFPASQQTEIMHRVTNVDEPAPEVLRDIERELESRLKTEAATSQRKSAGIAVAQAILAATKAGHRQELLDHLMKKDGVAANRSAPHNDLAPPLRTITEPKPNSPAITEPNTDAQNAVAGRRLNGVRTFDERRSASSQKPEKAAPGSPTVSTFRPAVLSKSRSETSDAEAVVSAEPDEPKIQIAFQDLVRMDNRSLATVLRYVSPQIALLALTGADSQLVDRIMKQLPARDAQTLRSRMNQIGPTRLSDMLAAQREFARIASRLISQGLIPMPIAKREKVAA